jgi:hypothetical protein
MKYNKLVLCLFSEKEVINHIVYVYNGGIGYGAVK